MPTTRAAAGGDAALISEVRARADADGALDVGAGLLVLAALEGDEPLDLALTDGAPIRPVRERAAAAPVRASAARAYLESLTVQGFRGVGARSELQVSPGPGLTLVVGRNGSGKSSFAEALELLLTGSNSRWATRSAVWRAGWRNLHSTGPTALEATFAIEGTPQPLIVRRGWPQDTARMEAGITRVRGARDGDDLAVTGWPEAMSIYRPFLPYNELGSIPDSKPSALYDMLSAALGLDALVDARDRLRTRRLAQQKQCALAESAREQWFSGIAALDDDRARTCAEAIGKPRAVTWALDDVELVLEGALEPPEGEIALLRGFQTLQPPQPEGVAATVAELRAAVEAERTTATTDAGRAQQLASLLELSLTVHAAHGDGPCPVCGDGTLNDAWRVQAEEEVLRLRKKAADARQARRILEEARLRARRLLVPPPETLDRADMVDIDPKPLRAAWSRWTHVAPAAPDDALMAHLQGTHPELVAAAAAFRQRAADELERREDAWRPLARVLREWLPEARQAVRGSEAITRLRSAEGWLQTETDRLRAERFRPIAERAAEVWALLRQNSSVALEGLKLAGTTSNRRVVLDVTVDDVGGQALGVMSQGEIHALALSLFLPRVLLPESPFGFVVIDDPVQAMDPGKVDGLARVLSRVAKTRQVMVFTHDERLPESVRRLQIPAHVIEVTRRAGSVVECRQTADPVSQYLDDAHALLKTTDLPPPATARAVSLFCRLAIEAACTETVRRRRIGRGEHYTDVEAALADARTLLQKLGSPFSTTPAGTGEVTRRINQRSREAADAVAWANRGPHEEDVADVEQCAMHVEATAGITRRLGRQR